MCSQTGHKIGKCDVQRPRMHSVGLSVKHAACVLGCTGAHVYARPSILVCARQPKRERRRRCSTMVRVRALSTLSLPSSHKTMFDSSRSGPVTQVPFPNHTTPPPACDTQRRRVGRLQVYAPRVRPRSEVEAKANAPCTSSGQKVLGHRTCFCSSVNRALQCVRINRLPIPPTTKVQHVVNSAGRRSPGRRVLELKLGSLVEQPLRGVTRGPQHRW